MVNVHRDNNEEQIWAYDYVISG